MSLLEFGGSRKPRLAAGADSWERGRKPFVPANFILEKYNPAGMPKGDPSAWKAEGRIELWPFLSAKNRESGSGAMISGWRVFERFKGSGLLNAVVLDYLLEHQDLIPASWKEKKVLFLGTVLRNRDNESVVPYLWCQGGEWKLAYESLDEEWGADYVLAMKKGSFKGNPFITPAKKAA
jgi:hypothetical protein